MIRSRMTKKEDRNPELVDALGAEPVAQPQRTRMRGGGGGQESAGPPTEDNLALVTRLCAEKNIALPAVLLLGGTDLLHVRARYAQSSARSDLTPSCWSFAAILSNDATTGWRVTQASTHGHASLAAIPASNAVCEVPLSDFADRDAFPNLAVLEFPVEERAKLDDGGKYLRRARLALDLVGPLAHWITYLWGVGQTGNPLLAGIPEPSALFVERVFAFAGVDITPGLAEPVVCPEAIWQAALLWRDFYEDDTSATSSATPRGFHVIGQKSAALPDSVVVP
jgi:hypothetical protein